MANGFPFSRGSGALLFGEDFDLPPPPPEPEIIEPVFTEAELIAAREQAARESRGAALAEADTSTRAVSGAALNEIARQLTGARDAAALISEQSAEATARLLLD